MDENFSNNLQNVNLDDIKTMCNDKDSDNIKTNCGASNDILSMNPIRNIPKDNIDSKVQQTKQYIAPAKALPPGTIINSTYQIVRKIAQGGMGVVYEALDLTIQRRVAIKMILSSFGESKYQTVLQRFINEINATAQLSHENIVHIYSSGFYQKQPYLVMEYIEGQSINQYVAQNCLSDWKKIAELIYKTAKGLDYIHKHNFLHRDIKPANILVTEDGEPILIDFGVVKDKNLAVEFTRQGKLLGTLQYMPIEQALGNNKEVDCRSDIYSLGIVLYELLTQQPAYSGNNHVVFKKILHEEPVQPRKINPEIPIELQRITLHAIAKEKNNRYKSAASFAQALGNYLYPEEIEAPLEDKKIQWHFSTGWNFLKRHQYLKKLDLSKQRKKRLVRIEKEDSLLKKILWSIILLIFVLFFVFIYFRFVKQTNPAPEPPIIYSKNDAKEIPNFEYKQTIKYPQSGLEYDQYIYKVIPKMSFIYIHNQAEDYLLAEKDCTQSIWFQRMKTKPWEGKLLKAKQNLYLDYCADSDISPEDAKSYITYKKNPDAIGEDKPVIWVDLYDCQEFCHRTNLTLMTKSQWEYAKKLEPFKSSLKTYRHYFVEKDTIIRDVPQQDKKELFQPFEADMITTFRCVYMIGSQNTISDKKNIHDKIYIEGFTYLGVKRFSLKQESESITQYMHEKSHIVFSLFSKKQDNGKISKFLMSTVPCRGRNWDYIMNPDNSNLKKEPIHVTFNSDLKKEPIHVTLEECKEFCKKANLSLPTISQWKDTCQEETNQDFINRSGMYILKEEKVFCKEENGQSVLKIKEENGQSESWDYDEKLQEAYLRLVFPFE